MISKNMMKTTTIGHAGEFRMDSNGDKLANYFLMSLDKETRRYRDAWTLTMMELNTTTMDNCTVTTAMDNCTEIGVRLNATFTAAVNFTITWPGDCSDRVYRAAATKRMGESSVMSNLHLRFL